MINTTEETMKDWKLDTRASSHPSRINRVRMREALREKLKVYEFTHFITLASNHQPLGYPRMRSLLKEWDARVNRELIGARWTKRPDERLLWFAFPEKLDVNPHWHLVTQVDPLVATLSQAARITRLPQIAKRHWVDLVPQGSIDIQRIDSNGILRYVTKIAADASHFEKFIIYREFMNI
ncbi:hypothetical protein D6850_13560 [Roseovarius spongiae]|uniref:Uncharacterized protein n=1 Tax=Roseovarius spongiae TaxID=2320272 RepID=A0A3A8B2T7_9RHOB|nr:hypothetical protein [Roseovarius spongiae]RKF14185.1 hypothetical protein D6850_13560 [Roseovarius spongiae]